MSQMELLPRIRKVKNFFDRISLKYIINPLEGVDDVDLGNLGQDVSLNVLDRVSEGGFLPANAEGRDGDSLDA